MVVPPIRLGPVRVNFSRISNFLSPAITPRTSSLERDSQWTKQREISLKNMDPNGRGETLGRQLNSITPLCRNLKDFYTIDFRYKTEYLV